MSEVIVSIISTYGIWGLILLLVAGVAYLVWKERQNNWGGQIEKLGDKMDLMEDRIELIQDNVNSRIAEVEERVINVNKNIRNEAKNEAKTQSIKMMTRGQSGRLSRILREYCHYINCDHIFIGGFHNGTIDLRGVHFCKFDILIDEFFDPKNLQPQDEDFQPLYKDANIITYGDLSQKISHLEEPLILSIDNLYDLSDTLYRRCKGRDIKSLAFLGIRDEDGVIFGFIGCVNYDDKKFNDIFIEKCAREIEGVYREDD